jgi:hypothetical protein
VSAQNHPKGPLIATSVGVMLLGDATERLANLRFGGTRPDAQDLIWVEMKAEWDGEPLFRGSSAQTHVSPVYHPRTQNCQATLRLPPPGDTKTSFAASGRDGGQVESGCGHACSPLAV